jgi:DNA-directed RNA polymerase subunit RPC12/RpoP
MTTKAGDNCVDCGEPTTFGSGRFVNRVPADDGYRCAECMEYPCDRCGEPIALDEDLYIKDGKGDRYNICVDCFVFGTDSIDPDSGLDVVPEIKQ